MFKPAGELAGLVREGAVSAREVVAACLARIESVDPGLNAFVAVDAEGALAAADEIARGDRRPFPGVPVAIKADTPVAGLPMTYGSRFLGGHRPDHSAYLVRRLREAGCIVVGVTNLAEFGILPTTEPRHHGPTRNPWDPARSPGGSSGGSAAAVCSGMVPVAHGNDGGGSLRIPAAACGLVGLKPSRGRISRGPDLGDAFLSVDGVLTRTVAETAQILDVLAGYEVGDATWAPRPVEPYGTAVRRDPGKLRIAVSAASPIEIDLDPECARGLRETAELLAGLGHEVEEADLVMPGGDLVGLFERVFGPAVSLGVTYGEALAGRPPAEDEIEPLSRAIAAQSERLSSVGLLAAVAQLQAFARSMVAFFADYDLLLTPSLAERPPLIGELHGSGADPLADFARSTRFTPYTQLANITGQPAISLPAGFGEDGLPTGTQLVAKPLGEETLLQVAAQIEAARHGEARRPTLSLA